MSTELIKVEEFSSIMQSAPDSLSRNQLSVQKASEAGQALIDTIEAEGMNDALDSQVANFLNKIKITRDNMEGRRKPITQLFDHVRKCFTSLENEIDVKSTNTVPGRLQALRNDYARRKLEEEKRRQAEALRLQNIENEKVTYKNALELGLTNHYNAFFNSKSNILSQIWSSINYAEFDEKARMIQTFSLSYPIEHFNMYRDTIVTYYIDLPTKEAIKREIVQGKYERFAQQYKFDMEDLRQSYIDRIPSLRKELEETERMRRVNTEEAKRLEAERKQREQEEQRKRELEAKQLQEKLKAEAEAQAQVGQMNNLFDAAAAATSTNTPVQAKVTEKIKVLHPTGMLEIYQMWWVNEGQNLPMDELEKIHKKMITFCEKKANKDNEHLKSKFVQYVQDVKAK